MKHTADDQRWRPRSHFTAPQNWMNDPCGLIYFGNRYHLYYQHNPHKPDWGSIHWGHAVSDDLFSWKDAPLAIGVDDEGGLAFTGSAMEPAAVAGDYAPADMRDGIVALYTCALPVGSDQDTTQRQCLATSSDGYVWEPGEMVIDNPGIRDFRDPKVGWHAESRSWFMVLAAQDRLHLYTSFDLRAWNLTDTFGQDWDAPEGIWECPDLLQLPVAGDDGRTDEDGRTEWVLTFHVEHFSDPSAGAYYVVGRFDGTSFVPTSSRVRPVDRGHDFYAAQSWANLPAEQQRQVWIAWASHPAYSRRLPTRSWVGAMTLPRELRLVQEGESLLLSQLPAREWETLRAEPRVATGGTAVERAATTATTFTVADADASDIVVPGNTCEIVLEFGTAGTVAITPTDGQLTVDRSGCDMGAFSTIVELRRAVDIPRRSVGEARTRVVLDGCVLECFLDDGTTAYTDLVFPTAPPSRIRVTSPASAAAVPSVAPAVYRMRATMGAGRGPNGST